MESLKEIVTGLSERYYSAILRIPLFRLSLSSLSTESSLKEKFMPSSFPHA